MPNFGGSAVGIHFVPKRNSVRPISFIAGTPDMIKNIVITTTDPTARDPQTLNSTRIIFSKTSAEKFLRGTFCWMRTVWIVSLFNWDCTCLSDKFVRLAAHAEIVKILCRFGQFFIFWRDKQETSLYQVISDQNCLLRRRYAIHI